MARNITIPLGLVAGLGVGLSAGGTVSPISHLMAGRYDKAAYRTLENFTGVWAPTGQFDINKAVGLKALVIGMILHKVVGGMLGVNRLLGRHKIPLIRL